MSSTQDLGHQFQEMERRIGEVHQELLFRFDATNDAFRSSSWTLENEPAEWLVRDVAYLRAGVAYASNLEELYRTLERLFGKRRADDAELDRVVQEVTMSEQGGTDTSLNLYADYCKALRVVVETYRQAWRVYDETFMRVPPEHLSEERVCAWMNSAAVSAGLFTHVWPNYEAYASGLEENQNQREARVEYVARVSEFLKAWSADAALSRVVDVNMALGIATDVFEESMRGDVKHDSFANSTWIGEPPWWFITGDLPPNGRWYGLDETFKSRTVEFVFQPRLSSYRAAHDWEPLCSTSLLIVGKDVFPNRRAIEKDRTTEKQPWEYLFTKHLHPPGESPYSPSSLAYSPF